MYKRMIRRAISVLFVCAAAQAQAGGYTNWATPTGYDIVTSSVPGIMVYGAFGNPGACTYDDRFFISKASNPEMYTQMVASIMSAKATGSQIMAYISICSPHNWYTAPSNTFGNLAGTALSVRN